MPSSSAAPSSSSVIETSSGNRIWRSSVLCGTDRLVVEGSSVIAGGAVLRGDLASICIGRYTLIDANVKLRPPTLNGTFIQQSIEDNCIIESGAVVRAAVVHACSHIGANAVIGERCVIGPCCVIVAGSVLPPDMVAAPRSVLAGSPAKQIATLPPSFKHTHQQICKAFYHSTKQYSTTANDVAAGTAT